MTDRAIAVREAVRAALYRLKNDLEELEMKTIGFVFPDGVSILMLSHQTRVAFELPSYPLVAEKLLAMLDKFLSQPENQK